MKLWHIGALVGLGLIVGRIVPGTFTSLFHDATLYVFLPALIFEGAWQLDASLMRRAWLPIVLLAVPGVVLTLGMVASIVYAFGHLPLSAALVLGAVLAATDPVAVVAIFRRVAVPPLLATIVESESLLNDAIAVVAYRAILAAILIAADASSVAHVAVGALLGSLLGITAGLAIGFAASFVLRRHVPARVQAVATFVAAYLAYGISERLEWSGIFAVIACALMMRELERRYDDVTMGAMVERAWGTAATIANALLFFLVGAAVDVRELVPEWHVLAWTVGAVLVARVVLAYGLLSLAPRMLRSWKSVVRLAGVRGALALALALGIPAAIPARAEIVDATFAVVVVTVLVGAFTYEGRISRLEL